MRPRSCPCRWIWGGHGARGQMDIEPIWAAQMGPILATHNGPPIWGPHQAHVGSFMGHPFGADMEPAAKWTSSPSGLPKWGPYWQPIMGRPFGAHTKPM